MLCIPHSYWDCEPCLASRQAWHCRKIREYRDIHGFLYLARTEIPIAIARNSI